MWRVVMTVLLAGLADSRLPFIYCYSCASIDYKDIFKDSSRRPDGLRHYLRPPAQFNALCSNPDAYVSHDVLQRCNTSCLSIIETSVTGGIFQQQMYIRGCADLLIKSPATFRTLGDHHLLVQISGRKRSVCQAVKMKHLYMGTKVDDDVEVCSCNFPSCNTSPAPPRSDSPGLGAFLSSSIFIVLHIIFLPYRIET